EERMRRHADRDVEITGLAAVAAGVPLARHTDARAIREARRDVDRQGLGAHLELFTTARRTARFPQASRPAAERARLREPHVPARRLDDASAVAMQAAALVDVEPADAFARPAMLLPR